MELDRALVKNSQLVRALSDVREQVSSLKAEVDWAKIAGKKRERIVHVRLLAGQEPRKRGHERAIDPGQCL